jgi:dihydroorotase
VDPAARRDGTFDLLLRGGVVVEVGTRLSADGAKIFDAAGLLVFPGYIDLHAHLREPGREQAETVATGLKAPAAGGSAPELAEFGEMRIGGAVAVSDDGKWLADGALLRRAFEHAGLFGLPVIQHCEDPSLASGAPMHEGAVSTRLGLPGQPAIAEAAAVARDLLVAEVSGGRLHVAHLSTARALELVREARARGIRVTCEVTPHHLTLTDEEIARSSFSTNYKMNPPLR